jgi:hypothetical protein
VTIREFFLENFAGDLEYHPRRGLLYMGLAIAAECVWIFLPYEGRVTAVPLIFALGGLALLVKGAFLFRKSSEGLGLSQQNITQRPDSPPRKSLPSMPANAAQVIQDFGTGSFLLWPLLNFGKDIDPSWDNAPRLTVFVSGAVLFFVGWAIRRFTVSAES